MGSHSEGAEIICKPCPFCGSERLETRRLWEKRRFVACKKCQAAGPMGLTESDAKIRWNKRVDLNDKAPRQEGLF